MSPLVTRTALALLASCACAAHAADWSDTSLSYRYGTKFAEPFNNNDITKNIVQPVQRLGLQVRQELLQRRLPDVVGSGSIVGRRQERRA